MPPPADLVFVEAAGRLHFGVFDLRGDSGRWFGGIGTAAPAPSLLVSAEHCSAIEVHGEDASRADGVIRAFLDAHGIVDGARVRVHRALPAHSGLGSGTQLALAIGKALAELYGIGTTPRELARVTGRGRRSAVGTWTFSGPGLVVEGGRYPASRFPGPLLARIPFPQSWACAVAVPHAVSLSGEAEEAAFKQLPRPSESQVHQVSHLVLMGLLPALVEADIAGFGRALSEIQEITGGWFAPSQGGAFSKGPSAGLIERMQQWGVPGIGQSSWGPAVYGIVDSEIEARRLADKLAAAMNEDGGGTVYAGRFPTESTRVWRQPLATRA